LDFVKERKTRDRTGCLFSSKTYKHMKLSFGKEVTKSCIPNDATGEKKIDSFSLPLKFHQ